MQNTLPVPEMDEMQKPKIHQDSVRDW